MSGPPGSTVTVSGTGFGAYEAVDLYFDADGVTLASTSDSGAFSGIAVGVPASGLPRAHYITAAGRRSGLSAQDSFLVFTSWPQIGYSADHLGVNPYENVLSPATVPGMDVDWMFFVEGGFTSSPAVAGGKVYASSSNTMYAIDAATGAQLWSATGGALASSPAVTNGAVVTGAGDSDVCALDAATGAQIWSFATGDEVASSPVVADGIVYVGSNDHNVYALDAATGAKLWSYATGEAVLSSPAVARERSTWAPRTRTCTP